MSILQFNHFVNNQSSQNYLTSDHGSTQQTVRGLNLYCNDTLATITTAGYLAPALNNIILRNNDLIYTIFGTASDQIGTFVVSISSANIVTLSAFVNIGQVASFDVTVPVASLATAGRVALITAATTVARYKIRSLQLNSGGTNFSGGGGDRLGQVTDATTVYSVIPAATMQSLTNAQWGATALPNPASAAINTSTVAGANLSFGYSQGATDYTAGSLVITGLYQRVA